MCSREASRFLTTGVVFDALDTLPVLIEACLVAVENGTLLVESLKLFNTFGGSDLSVLNGFVLNGSELRLFNKAEDPGCFEL